MYYIVKQELDEQETNQTLMINDEIRGPVAIKAAFSLNGFFLTEARNIEEAETASLKRKLLMALFADYFKVEILHMSPDFASRVFNPLREQLKEKLKDNNTNIQLEVMLNDVEDIRWGFNLRVPLSLVGVHHLNATCTIDYSYQQSLEYVSISEMEYNFLLQQFGNTYGQCLLLNTNRLLVDDAICQIQLNIKRSNDAVE